MRILFAFDPPRHAILLVAGNWREWYGYAVPTADWRYRENLTELDTAGGRR